MKKILLFAAVVALGAGCSNPDSLSPSSGYSTAGGRGGSMARFTINGDFLYTVDDSRLKVVSIADPSEPIEGDAIYVGGQIETIFTMNDHLFIGSQGAMYIYDISKPEFPKRMSATNHLRSCDPVVACDTLAFVTLNSSLGSWCGQTSNVIQSYDISDIENPVLLDSYGLSSPRGLAVDGEAGIVFVCDNGIKAIDITLPHDLEPMYTSNILPELKRINTYDCIILDGVLLVIGSDGLYQLSYDRKGFKFISKIDIRTER